MSDAARRTRPPLHADYRVQQQVLAARVRTHLIQRQNGSGPLSAATLAVRWRLLNQMVKILAWAGQPLRAPDDLNRAHIECMKVPRCLPTCRSECPVCVCVCV